MVEPGVTETLPGRAGDLAILCEIGEVLNSSLELGEILNMILIGVTAGQGLRFNRAFLLLIDESDRRLKGSLAIGPDDAEQAARVWGELENSPMDLRRMLLTFGARGVGDGRVRHLVDQVSVPLEDSSHFLARAIESGASRVVRREDGSDESECRFAELLGVNVFALVPILSRGGPVGVLLADNVFTHRNIDATDLHLLKLFAGHAGTAIEKARLYARLLEEKNELETAHGELRRNQQTIIGLQRLSDLGEMAARVAHEIRNPLVAIGGFARRMLSMTPPEDSRHKPLQIVVGEVGRLEQILREVLDYARPMKLNAKPADLNGLVRQSVEAISPECEALDVVLHADYDDSCPVTAADSALLRVALVNLLRNAIQAISSEGRRGGRIDVATRRAGELLEISVRDSGPGIPPEAEHRIFEPFFTTKASGSGLGLAIVSQILREHGGRVRYESRPGEGATFLLDLPLTAGAAACERGSV